MNKFFEGFTTFSGRVFETNHWIISRWNVAKDICWELSEGASEVIPKKIPGQIPKRILGGILRKFAERIPGGISTGTLKESHGEFSEESLKKFLEI